MKTCGGCHWIDGNRCLLTSLSRQVIVVRGDYPACGDWHKRDYGLMPKRGTRVWSARQKAQRAAMNRRMKGGIDSTKALERR